MVNPNPKWSLEVAHLAKRLGGVQALRDVSMRIEAGEVHGLVGANGAGKSTLIRSLAGIIRPDSGTILINGIATDVADAASARTIGLGFIHQELNLIEHFTVLENLALGLPKPGMLGVINWAQLRERAREVSDTLGFDFSLRVAVSDLSVAQKWLVAIGRSLMSEAKVIAMDEPTASLSTEECERLFNIVRSLSRSGVAVLYVSHRLDEIVELCDRVTVFRDGASVEELSADDITVDSLVHGIVGNAVSAIDPRPARAAQGREVLQLRAINRAGKLRDVSLTLHAGEILGLGGLVGSGRSELARVMFGADRTDSGEILLEGRAVRFAQPADAVANGIALVPEERRSQGLVLLESVRFNAALPGLHSLRAVPWLPLVSARSARARADRIVSRLGVKVGSVDTPVWQLSGGNQQKVVIGKWLDTATHVVILDEPTRGVDIGARQDIYSAIRDLAESGLGVIVISSELSELSLCDRVLVMSEGAVVGELKAPDISEAAILKIAYASHRPSMKDTA